MRMLFLKRLRLQRPKSVELGRDIYSQIRKYVGITVFRCLRPVIPIHLLKHHQIVPTNI